MSRKSRILKIVFISIAVLALLGYMLFAFVYFSDDDAGVVCKELVLEIKQNTVPLLTEDDVHEILNTSALHPLGKAIEHVDLDQLEQLMEEHPMIKQATCYHTPSGKVHLILQLRDPKFLVMAGETYYVDEEKAVMPISLQAAAYVPVITGRVTKTMALNELFDFVSFLDRNAFWNAQIAQIHIHPDRNVELAPRVGSTSILLGELDNYEDKLERVYLLYTQAFNVFGWNRYKKLDLRFDHQIVAIKKDKEVFE